MRITSKFNGTNRNNLKYQDSVTSKGLWVLNDWIFCELKETNEVDCEEINKVYSSALTYRSNVVMGQIKKDGFGILGSDEDERYYLVRWTSNTYTLQEATDLFGCKTEMPAGTVVVEGIIYQHLPYNPGWHQPPDYT